MHRRLVSFCSLASLAACTWSPPRPPPLVGPPLVAPPPVATKTVDSEKRFDIALAPHRSSLGVVDALDVTLTLSGIAEDSLVELGMDEEVEGESGWPEALGDFVSHDAKGPLHFDKRVVTEEGDRVMKWRSDRSPSGAVEIAYRVNVPTSVDNHFTGLREHAGGLEGMGEVFIPRPHDESIYATHVHWDLKGLGADATAFSSFGANDAETKGGLDRIGHADFMAGPLNQLAIDHESTHFRGVWLGKPAFDPAAAVTWSARVRDYERGFFQDNDATSLFTFFMRAVPNQQASWVGGGRTAGFLFLPGGALTFSRPARFVIAHELIHHWIGGSEAGIRLEGPEGSAYWLTEGLTVYYTSVLMLRSRLASPKDVGDDLRERTSRFAINPFITAPNEEIVKGFWKNHDLSLIPYDRGLLYAAEVDALIRAHSNGKRSLDNLVLTLLDRARKDADASDEKDRATVRLPSGIFRDLLGLELGPNAQERFDAVIVRGELPRPPSDAFGPCFKAFSKRLPKFDLGFAMSSLTAKRIDALEHGSSAEHAGVHEGDTITAMSIVLGEPEKKVELTLVHDGKEKKISYLPEGAKVDATIWDRDTKVSDAQCTKR